jgi:HPt (histidine-containing phosphotransfer) domain-containing protein
MDRYLSKPFTIEQLHRILESCVPDEEGAAPEAAAPQMDAQPAAAQAGVVGPVAAAPSATAPAARTPVAPEPIAAVPVAPEPAARTRVAPEPIAAVPVAPEPVAAPPIAPEPDAALLDEATLDRIRDLHRRGGPNLLPKMAELYASSSLMLIGSLREAVGARDADGVSRAAHALKSSSGSVGATLLTDLCEALEKAGRAGELDGVGAVYERLLWEHARVLRALDTVRAAA